MLNTTKNRKNPARAGVKSRWLSGKTILTLILSAASACCLNAQTTFQKTYGGSNDDDMFGLTRTSDGGFAMVGNTRSFGDLNGDAYLIKTDSSGTLLWSKVYHGNGAEEMSSVRETADHGFIITGGTSSAGAGSFDALLIKTDSVGNLTWSKVYGGAGYDYFTYCVQTFDGGYISTGSTTSSGAGNFDVMIVRANSAGD